ncbi:MAG TPA: hypothetical protein VF403_24790 [Kofleriaceae bacterium]
MRLALLLLLASSCTTSGDHAVTGTYLTNYDGVVVNVPNGSSGASVVEVTARDQDGYTLDDGYFHSESVSSTFSVIVPNGSINVDVFLKTQTTDGNDRHVEYQIDGPIENDVDLGLVDLE